MIKTLLVAGFVFLSLSVLSQEVTVMRDSTIVQEEQDTVQITTYAAKRFNPRKALFFSAILPGMGQVYNNKYWKVPLVYGGLIGGIYVVKIYQDQYLQYKGELFTMLNENNTGTSVSGFTQDQLRSIITKTRRQRDYFSIITCLWYFLQIMDAHVDAHLKEFELNPELHVKVEPMVESDQLIGRNTGVSLKFKFR